MSYAGLRRMALYVFIGFLGLTALLAVAIVLGGSMDELQVNMLLTTLVITYASLCVMSCLAYNDKRGHSALGLLGIAIALASTPMLLILIWTDFNFGGEAFGKTSLSLVILAIAFAHALLLALADLDPGHRWVQGVAAATISALALSLVVMVWGETFNDTMFRVILVLAIFIALETLVIPILTKLRHTTSVERLVLTRVHDDVYRAADGQIYTVHAAPDA